MPNKDIVKKVEEFLIPILEENSLELWDIEFIKQGQNFYLKVFIDKKDGITLEECEFVTRKLNEKLDKLDDIITNSYILEVSSPGINRSLKKDSDFLKYIGEIIDIKLYKSHNNKKDFQGELISFEEGIVTILDEDNIKHEFLKKELASCKLAMFF